MLKRKRTSIVDEAREAAKKLVASKALESFKKRTAAILATQQGAAAKLKDPQETSLKSAMRKFQIKRQGKGKGKGRGQRSGRGGRAGAGRGSPRYGAGRGGIVYGWR